MAWKFCHDIAVPAIESLKHWDINQPHRVFNHASEETLQKTAQHYGWTVTGQLKACADCQTSNMQQCPVPKFTESKSETSDERIFMDINSNQHHSFGGSKFWLGCVDDATDLTWSTFLKRKSDIYKKL